MSGKNQIGGGFSFARNLWKSLKSQCFLTDNINDEFDIALIIGPTTISRDDVKKIKARNIPIVLRCDNIPEDYRNRGTAISRLKDYSKMADVVIYQSKWARDYVKSLTGVGGAVIYNGVDKDIFNTEGRIGNKNILYVRSSTNENKRWQEAKYWFREMWLEDNSWHFYILGNFADYIKLFSDDFINSYRLGLFDEPHTYLGQMKTAEEMATVFKESSILLAPYYNDACSNTILEARACGLKIETCHGGMSGGTPELLELHDDLIGIDRMGREYIGVFKLTLQ